jgi:hypothetical protein
LRVGVGNLHKTDPAAAFIFNRFLKLN